MKKYIKRSIKIVLCLVFVCGIVLFTQNRFDHNSLRMEGFYYEDKDSLDVVLLGASEIYTGFSSGQAYGSYGFSSYPYAVERNTVDLYKYETEEILEHQTPKLLVVEINGALYENDKILYDDVNLRRVTDSIPPSDVRTKMINEFGDKDNLLSYHLPFIKYHGSASSFKRFINSFQLKWNNGTYLKGITTKTFAKKLKPVKIKDPDAKKNLHPLAESEFRKYLDYCKENVNVEILFVRFPHAITSKKMIERYKLGNRIGDIIEEYGYKYVNFEKELDKINFDYSKDFYNSDHMNINGQEKFTDYFCKYLTDNYDLSKTKLTEAQKEKWDKSAEYVSKFYDYARELMKNNKKIRIYETVDVMHELNK